MKLIVKKTLAHTMRWESKLVLAKYKPKVIAITGSVGKTSTKDAVYATIAKISHVRKSEKSFNSELGLPLTILGCPNGWNNIFAWLKNLKYVWHYPFANRILSRVSRRGLCVFRNFTSFFHRFLAL